MTAQYVSFKVTGEFITNHLRTLYYADDLAYDEVKSRFIKSFGFDALDEETKDKLFKELIYGKKKFVGINEFDFVEDTDFDVYAYSRFSRPTFVEGAGVRGILTQDGIFVQCEYGGHFGAIDWIGKKATGGIVFHLHWHDSDMCGVYSDVELFPLTDMQLEWIESHKQYLTTRQIRDVERQIELNSHMHSGK